MDKNDSLNFNWFRELLDDVARIYGFNNYEEAEAYFKEQEKTEITAMKNQHFNRYEGASKAFAKEIVKLDKISELSDPVRKETTAIPKDYNNDILIDLYLFSKDRESK